MYQEKTRQNVIDHLSQSNVLVRFRIDNKIFLSLNYYLLMIQNYFSLYLYLILLLKKYYLLMKFFL